MSTAAASIEKPDEGGGGYSAGPPVVDADLVSACARGDAEALAELYNRYCRRVMGLATRILSDPTAAEEVTQEAFLYAWQTAGRYDPARSSVSTWLTLIARSRSIDRLRKRQTGQRTKLAAAQAPSENHVFPSAFRGTLENERAERVATAVGELPEAQRRVLELCFFAGMTQSEAAKHLRIPLGTVKTRSLLAMRKLRRSLGAEITQLI